jgi:hypothetical protein
MLLEPDELLLSFIFFDFVPAVSAFDVSGRIASPRVVVPALSALVTPLPWLPELSRPAAPPFVPSDVPLPEAPLDDAPLAPDDVLGSDMELDPLAPDEPLAPEDMLPDPPIASPLVALLVPLGLVDVLPELSRPIDELPDPEPVVPVALCACAPPNAIRSALVNTAVLNLFMNDSFVV